MGTTGSDGNDRDRDEPHGDDKGEKEDGKPPHVPTAQDDYKGPIVLTPQWNDDDYDVGFPHGDLASVLEQRLDFGRQVAIILIDMGSKDNFDEQYGPLSVGEEQLALIEKAKQLEAQSPGQIHFVEIWVELFDKETGKRLGGSVTLEVLRNALPKDRLKIFKPSFNAFQGTTLEADLQSLGIETAVVMGFSGNLCVKNTIFGTNTFHYPEGVKTPIRYRGLLDLGIEVVTSRLTLATDHAKLESEYRLDQAPPNTSLDAPPNTKSLKRTGSQSSGSKPGHHEKRKGGKSRSSSNSSHH